MTPKQVPHSKPTTAVRPLKIFTWVGSLRLRNSCCAERCTNGLDQPLIGSGGGVDHLPVREEGAETFLLKSGTLVAHIHLLLNVDTTAMIHTQVYITQLSPGDDHHGQVCAPVNQETANIAGSHAFRGIGTVDGEVGQTGHGGKPVHKCQNTQ